MQLSLFDGGRPTFDPFAEPPERRALEDGAWVEYLPAWLDGHASLMRDLLAQTEWRHERRRMYDRVVDVPRLTAPAPENNAAGRLIKSMAATLCARYRSDLGQVSLAYYRDGRDSVAPHGDKIGVHRSDTVIAIVSLGAPRRFSLKRVSGRQHHAYSLGWGDLLVMGGTCQRTWLHGVPKVAHADPRISLVFRPSPRGLD